MLFRGGYTVSLATRPVGSCNVASCCVSHFALTVRSLKKSFFSRSKNRLFIGQSECSSPPSERLAEAFDIPFWLQHFVLSLITNGEKQQWVSLRLSVSVCRARVTKRERLKWHLTRWVYSVRFTGTQRYSVAFAKQLRKATICFVTSVCPHRIRLLPYKNFAELYTLDFYQYLSTLFKFRPNRADTWRPGASTPLLFVMESDRVVWRRSWGRTDTLQYKHKNRAQSIRSWFSKAERSRAVSL